ncbi:conserved putative chloride channel [Candidatus Vecturithrix granuli]|uniref:Conserved putative chloride channel n=1 Tax=Vecturithrix granuli TaxID=1499967 RepID=A0A081C1D9_VECG1|nr:conserved putative chloride channel [Candidatus Vecturithrix granuli]
MPISFDKPLFLLVWLLIPLLWIMMRRSFLQGSARQHRLLIGAARSILLLVLGFALADPRLMTRSDQVNILFCLDVSQSVGSEQITAAQEFMRQAVAGMNPEDQAGLVVFGKHPSLEISLSSEFEPRPIRSDVNTNFTNIHEALQFAIGKLPQQGKNKIVLFSDGNENLQQAVDMAYLAASLGIEIDPAPLGSWYGQGEVFLQKLETPATVALETPFEIRIAIMSSVAQQGELVLLRNETLLATQTVNLQSGKNVVIFADTLSEPGLFLYKAVVNVPNDLFFQNNEGLAFIKGTRKAQILYLSGDAASDPFAETLTAQGLHLVRKQLTELSGSIYDLLEYNAIILNNISGQPMSFTIMENMQTYVKDMGGGLIMIGGDQSFGAGAYKKTPIEDALPVFMDAPTDLKFSALCLIFVIDKSSSMTTRYAGKSKLEMAKIAAFSSIELLNPTDRVGIVAFDSQFKWIVPIMNAMYRQEIADRLTQIKEGGGTILYPPLEDVFNTLQTTEAARKHIIILSDGMTDKADFETLVKSMSAADISVSTVSIGSGADLDLMRSIAKWGNGRSYYTEDPATIPRIFTGETQIVSKELISEKTLLPTPMMLHEMLQGLQTDAFPPLYGQVITYPKPGANVLVNTSQGPLLAAWQYGLGRSVAFTSDLSGRWGKEWVQWKQYGQFAAQMVKWAQRKDTPKNYAATIERNGEQGIFTVDVTDAQNQFVNNLDLKVNLLAPSEQSQTLSLTQIAPGRYQTTFPAEEIGDYYVSVFAEQSEEAGPPEVFGFGVPYTDEFSTTGVNTDTLEQLAALTNGAILSFDNIPRDLFTVQTADTAQGQALWPFVTMSFLALLLVDVALRKLINPGVD